VVGAGRIEERIEEIGRKFLKEDIFIETRKQVHNFANQNPITGTFSNIIIFATETKPGQPSTFENVISIPMSPFTALKGVDRTATAISDARGSLDNISAVVEHLPESVRWQLLLLMLEMEDIEAVKTILASMTKLSDSSAKLADSAEKLPERLREQISILVEDIDSKQANIQTSLDKGENTAIAVEKVFTTAGQTIGITGDVAKNVDEAAEGWKNAVDATSELIQVIRQWIAEMPKKEPSEKTSVSDYKDTAQEVTDAANELRALVTDVRGLLESETLSGHIEDVNNRVLGAIDQSAVNAQSVTDHIAWRIIQLAGAIFVMALLYRFISRYLRVKPR
jgi:methyl-accepting chemotaxis protein